MMSVAGDATAAYAADIQGNDVGACMERLRIDCEESWTQVKDTQRQLGVAQRSNLTSQPPNKQPLISILQEKERRLRAEIEIAKESTPLTLPNEPQVIEAVLLGELQKNISEMKETLSLVESHRQELVSSIEQQQQSEHQLLAVNQKLQEKQSQLEREQPMENPLEAVGQELEDKIQAARATQTSIMKSMAQFVDTHYPVPDPDQVVKTSKDLRSQKQHTNRQTLPLKDILLDLMTRCVESPAEPYLQLDERHWPAYVELLLRCNIILQHPDDDRRIKLVPFHM